MPNHLLNPKWAQTWKSDVKCNFYNSFPIFIPFFNVTKFALLLWTISHVKWINWMNRITPFLVSESIINQFRKLNKVLAFRRKASLKKIPIPFLKRGQKCQSYLVTWKEKWSCCSHLYMKLLFNMIFHYSFKLSVGDNVQYVS